MDIEELLKKYKAAPTTKIRNQIIEATAEKRGAIVSKMCLIPHLKDDMEQEAVLAVIDAIKAYKSNGKFMACVGFWIKKRIFEEFGIKNGIKISACVRQRIKKIKQFLFDFEEKHGRPPKTEEVLKEKKLRPKTYAALRYYIEDNINLNGTEGMEEYFHIFKKEHFHGEIILNEKISELRSSFLKLRKRDQYILGRRYGINCKKASLKTLAMKIGKTTQRVQQMQVEAENNLKKLFKNH